MARVPNDYCTAPAMHPTHGRAESKSSQAAAPPSLPINHRLSLLNKLPWWQANAPANIYRLIKEGVRARWSAAPPKSIPPFPVSSQQSEWALQLLKEYADVGAVRELTLPEIESTHYFVPWFVIEKPKLRFILNCKALNSRLRDPPRFRLDGWREIFPLLTTGMWGGKVDLKNAYFHLGVNPELGKFLNVAVDNRVFRFQSAAFGLKDLPYLWMRVMGVPLRIWRAQGMIVFVYLDDILILGNSPQQVRSHLEAVLTTLANAGLVVNHQKSVLQPSQCFEHLGLLLDLRRGELTVPLDKRKGYRKELGKVLTNKTLTVRKVAAILGRVRSLLPALPALRAFTDHLVKFVAKGQGMGWDSSHPIPEALRVQVREATALVTDWPGRRFLSPNPPDRELSSDACTHGWGGVDNNTGAVVHEHWFRQAAVHINLKELIAAVNTTQSLARPGERVRLDIDNSVAFSYIKMQGGKIRYLNQELRPLLTWANKNRVDIEPVLVPSADMKADPISRWWFDPGEYSLDRGVFLRLLRHFPSFPPKIDMFASPQNTQLPVFCSRWPHFQASLVDALSCPLDNLPVVFANPPWAVVGEWLTRLRQNPHLVSVTVLPLWASVWWWRLALSLRVPHTVAVKIPPAWGVLRDACFAPMKPMRTPLCCLILSGSAFKTGALRPPKWTPIWAR